MDEVDPAWWFLTPERRAAVNPGGPPPPPYHLQDCTLVGVNVAFDEATIARTVPKALRATPERTGGFALSFAGAGWGIAPYSSSFAWIDVEGHDSSDGGKGRFHAGGYLSGACGRAFQSFFRNARVEIGDATLRRQPDLVGGASGGQRGEALRLALRPGGASRAGVSGVNYYLHEDREGGLCICSAAYSMDMILGEPAELDIVPGVGGPYVALRPERILWAGIFTGSHTLSEPKSLAMAPGAVDTQAKRMLVLNVFTQLGRPAILVGRSNRIIAANRRAEPLLGAALFAAGGVLRAARAQDQRNLDRIVEAALSAGGDRLGLETVAVTGGDGRGLLLVQALPVPSRYDAPAAVLLLNDPGAGAADVAGTLQLLGLTPAEARTAAFVGTGLSHRETAERIGIAEGTVRVALTRIYAKLGLSRASELAGLVNRLGLIGGPNEAQVRRSPQRGTAVAGSPMEASHQGERAKCASPDD